MNKFLLLLLFPVFTYAQTAAPPRLVKTEVGNSGCFAYLPGQMPAFEVNYSEDGAEVYTSETVIDSFSYACIGVKFTEPFSDYSPDELEELLISYLDYLKGAFEISSSTGYGKGHTLESEPLARGVLDYWQDETGLQYVIKAWVNPSNIGVLIIYGKGDYPFYNAQQMYLDGWRFE